MKCDFSIKHYEYILKTALGNNYRFIGFDEFGSARRGERICILRHDVDYVPEWSLIFGEIEKKLGIRSTFFFQVCAKPYNLREAETWQVVRRLHEMGHRIGLHFDANWKKVSSLKEIPAMVRDDKKVLKAITGITPCEIISIHNPNMTYKPVFNRKVSGIVHTYEKRFFKGIKYLSDSQGWQEGCVCTIFETAKYPRIQLLTHSYIWPKNSSGDFIKDIAAIIKINADELTQYFVDWHPVCKKSEKRLRSLLKI